MQPWWGRRSVTSKICVFSNNDNDNDNNIVNDNDNDIDNDDNNETALVNISLLSCRWCEMAYFAVMWTTGSLADKILFYSSYPNRACNFITGEITSGRNLMLHFQMNLSWMSFLAKERRPGTSQHSSAEYDQLNYSSF